MPVKIAQLVRRQLTSMRLTHPSIALALAIFARAAAACGVDGYLVARAGDDRNITSGVYAARVRRDGAVLDEKPIELSKTSRVGPRPSVAWNGSAFLVIWTEPPSPTGGGGVL